MGVFPGVVEAGLQGHMASLYYISLCVCVLPSASVGISYRPWAEKQSLPNKGLKGRLQSRPVRMMVYKQTQSGFLVPPRTGPVQLATDTRAIRFCTKNESC